ncbi:MAG: hypothetical protein HKP45_09340, partial [Winogradskyella sp.]|nr:hypothetical protein [Winogradskyella sp.]
MKDDVKTIIGLLQTLPLILLATSCSTSNKTWGMWEDKNQEDLRQLPADLQQIVAKTQARTTHYQIQAEKEEKELEVQEQTHTAHLATLRTELTTKM